MGHTSGRFKRFVEKDENRFTARDAKQLNFSSEGTSITNVRQMQHFRERPPATGGWHVSGGPPGDAGMMGCLGEPPRLPRWGASCDRDSDWLDVRGATPGLWTWTTRKMIGLHAEMQDSEKMERVWEGTGSHGLWFGAGRCLGIQGTLSRQCPYVTVNTDPVLGG